MGPADWHQVDSAARERPSQVVIVPGFLDSPRLYRRLAARLEAAGHDVHTFPPRSSTGAVEFERTAADLAAFIDRRIGPEGAFGLVGFSMGGIAARYYVQRLGGAARVRVLVTVSSPHRGTWTAWLLPLRGIRQLRPRSGLLEDLNRDVNVLAEVGFASIWSPVDFVIVPPSSSHLGIGAERRFFVPIHAWVPQSGRVLDEVVRLLEVTGRSAQDGSR
jgi:triacylglycerol lipase